MNDSRTNSLRHIIEQQPARAVVLAITSGKGGVGKTNIASNLSICLASANQRVVLMDADLGLGNLDVVMNINSRYNLSHVVSGHKSLDEILHLGPGGVDVICGGSGLEQMADLSLFQRQRLIDEMDTLQKKADWIILDTGAGIHASVVGFCMACDHTLVVTTPEPTAMTDAYAMIKVLSGKQYDGRISLLVNMAATPEEGRKTYRQISEVASRFLNVPVYDAGVLCRDEYLTYAVRKRQPVVLAYPRAAISGHFASVSARLTNLNRQPVQKDGFFKKVVNWFL